MSKDALESRTDEVVIDRYSRKQDEGGRLWDVISMLCMRLAQGGRGSSVLFRLETETENNERELVTLRAVCGPGDAAEPVITIMLPWED